MIRRKNAESLWIKQQQQCNIINNSNINLFPLSILPLKLFFCSSNEKRFNYKIYDRRLSSNKND